jgi:HSP20 family protein
MDLHSEVDRLFDDFARGFAWPRMGRGVFPSAPAATMMSTRVNVAETDSAYEIEAELPGLDEKDIEVNLADDILTISGERKEEQEDKKKDYHVMERRYGAFRRSFELPANVAEDKIEAKFSKGVLTVTLPKTAPSPAKANEKKIEIKSA